MPQAPTKQHPALTWLTPSFAVTAGLQSDDFERLAALGVKAVISNRPDGEEAGQLTASREAVLAWRAGLMFRHVPSDKHSLFTDRVVDGMGDALRELDSPVVAHCASGMRSAIVWAAAVSRSQPVDCVLAALERCGFELDFIRDDLDAQADRKRWLGHASPLDCSGASEVVPLLPARTAA